MDVEQVRQYCLAKKGTSEYFPFDEQTLCFKVGTKLFALVDIQSRPVSINLKCDPDRALELRAMYNAIRSGYHMNKKHWNTVTFDVSLPLSLQKELIDHSYDLVYKSLTKLQKAEIEKQE